MAFKQRLFIVGLLLTMLILFSFVQNGLTNSDTFGSPQSVSPYEQSLISDSSTFVQAVISEGRVIIGHSITNKGNIWIFSNYSGKWEHKIIPFDGRPFSYEFPGSNYEGETFLVNGNSMAFFASKGETRSAMYLFLVMENLETGKISFTLPYEYTYEDIRYVLLEGNTAWLLLIKNSLPSNRLASISILEIKFDTHGLLDKRSFMISSSFNTSASLSFKGSLFLTGGKLGILVNSMYFLLNLETEEMERQVVLAFDETHLSTNYRLIPLWSENESDPEIFYINETYFEVRSPPYNQSLSIKYSYSLPHDLIFNIASMTHPYVSGKYASVLVSSRIAASDEFAEFYRLELFSEYFNMTPIVKNGLGLFISQIYHKAKNLFFAVYYYQYSKTYLISNQKLTSIPIFTFYEKTTLDKILSFSFYLIPIFVIGYITLRQTRIGTSLKRIVSRILLWRIR